MCDQSTDSRIHNLGVLQTAVKYYRNMLYIILCCSLQNTSFPHVKRCVAVNLSMMIYTMYNFGINIRPIMSPFRPLTR